MKKIILIILGIILVPIAILFGPAIVVALGSCGFLGFLILGGLDAIGLIHIDFDTHPNLFFTLAIVIGLVIFVIYFLITGQI